MVGENVGTVGEVVGKNDGVVGLRVVGESEGTVGESVGSVVEESVGSVVTLERVRDP